MSDPCDFDGFSFEMAFVTVFSELSTVVIISLKYLSRKSGKLSGPSDSKTLDEAYSAVLPFWVLSFVSVTHGNFSWLKLFLCFQFRAYVAPK